MSGLKLEGRSWISASHDHVVTNPSPVHLKIAAVAILQFSKSKRHTSYGPVVLGSSELRKKHSQFKARSGVCFHGRSPKALRRYRHRKLQTSMLAFGGRNLARPRPISNPLFLLIDRQT